MQKRIPKPFTLFLIFFFLSNYLSGTPDCPIMSARFQLADGTTSDPSATGWYLNATNVASTGIFSVKSNRLHAQELGGEGIWYSRVFSNPGYSEFQVAVKVSSEGDMNSSEYVKIYYKINGGAEVLLDQRTGNFGTIDFISPALTGNNVQLVVKLYNYNNGGSQTSKYYIEEYRMFKEKGPCTVSSGITVTTAAANGGILTCASPSLGLSATATGTGTTTWAWTGPNGYTSTAQNPTITTAGTYTVVATNSTGTGSASVTVTENKTAPVITATGGALACGSCVSISATSNVSGATYSWSGPGSFTSTSQNPTVCAAGTYTVTVTNPANGCSAQQSVSVTAGSSAATTFWLEDFTGIANGTTSDAGTTAWTTSVTGSGTYSVQNNEYKVSFSGSQGVGTWTSQVIDISSKTNVTFSVDLRSEVASTSDALENTDYIRIYYKLNGGAETMVFEDLAGVGSTTNTTASTTFNSSSLNGSTLQVIIKASNSDPTERYFFDNIKVSGSNAGTTTVTPSVTGNVTCTSTAQLSATASSTVSAWSWTGPNGFTSAQQNPSVNAGGQYIVTATLSSGCLASATITVPENKTLPDVTATGGTLACLPGITLNANSTVSGVSYSWTGPNGFTSSSKNPTVNAAGTYIVTVTNPANGCSNQQAVSVTSGASAPATFWLEDFTGLSNGATSDAGATAWTSSTSGSGTYSVQNNEFKTSFNEQAEGVWTSQIVSISGKSNVTISVDLRSEVTSSNSWENSDYIRVYYKLNGGAETLVYEDLGGIGSSTTGTASTTITSAALNGSTLQVIIKTNNSGPTERYYFDNITITGGDITGESVTATGGAITCINSSVTLLGNATSGGVSYSWTGPNNFTSTAQNPVVTATGIYTLTVHNPATGCSGSDTALVALNTTGPGASASASGSLSCTSGSSVTLSGSSSTSGVTYSWTGPNNFTSAEQNPVITVAGSYTLTVTNKATGCTSTASTSVTMSSSSTGTIWLEDFTWPNGTTSDAGNTAWTTSKNPSTAVMSVLNNELRVTNCTTTGEVVWTSGAISVAGKNNIIVSAGTKSSVINNVLMNDSGELMDYLRFYYKLNNGAEVLFAEKRGIINNHSTTPTPVSVTIPNGNYSTLQVIIKSRATANDEFYYVDNIQVVATTQSVINAVATATDILTCTQNSVGLTGSTSATTPVNYSWTGPGSFSSTVQNPSAIAAGIYTLTVTDPSTGCTGSDTALVSLNNTAPGASAAGGTLTCTNGSSATLSGSSSTSGVSYSWTGPNNFTSTTQNPLVTAAGTYNLTVTNPVNGCTSTASATVTLNNTISSTWLEDFTLANGTTSDAGATAWTTSKTVSAAVIAVQNNEIRITNCTTTGDVVWTSATLDMTGKTNISISAGVKSSIINNAVMNTDPTYGDYIRFYYKLNNGTEVLFAEKTAGINNHSTTPTPVSVTIPSGSYNTLQVVVRARATGNDEFYYFDNMQVVASGSANIQANATGGAINCINNSVALQGSSATSGVSYAWSGPNGYTSTVQNPVVTTPGNYTLTVALGSCTANAIATVTQDTTHPVITASANPLQLTCTATPSTLTANSNTPGVSYSWRNAAGIIIASTPSTSVTTPGNYTLTVTNPVNGCSSGSLIIVTQDTIAPTGITASHTGIITCLNPSISIAATVSSTGTNYSWTGPNGFTASTLNASITKGGTYIFTATNPTNGCTAIASTVVEENTTPPGEISINNSGTINCLTSSVTISGSSSSSGVNYKWTSPNGFSSSSATATVTHGGLYTLTATNPVNGCTSNKSTTVNENTTPPSITISNNSPISCANPVVTLSVVTNATNASYLWLGDDLISDSAVVHTATAGLYILTVTDQLSGCGNQELVEVTEDYSDCGARKVTTVASNASAQQSIQEVTVNNFTYKAYPNPVITNGVIEFTSPQSATATVSIYNALGTCEKVLFKGTVMANRANRVSVPATQLAAGAYYYIINSGGKSFTGKLVIVK